MVLNMMNNIFGDNSAVPIGTFNRGEGIHFPTNELPACRRSQAGRAIFSCTFGTYLNALFYARNSRVRTEGLDELVDDLGKLFIRKSAKSE